MASHGILSMDAPRVLENSSIDEVLLFKSGPQPTDIFGGEIHTFVKILGG